MGLYRELLGDDFELLPEPLRRFHDAPGGGRAEGALRVTRGSGLAHRAVGWLGGFPDPGERVPLRLEVQVLGARERWVRFFDGRPVESVQWREGELFAESAGPLVFLFRLAIEDGLLRFRFVHARLLGVPIPRWLGPSGDAHVREAPEGWSVDVELRAPLVGLLLRYEGLVRPTG